MKKTILGMACLLLLAAASPFVADAALTTRTLRYGDVSEDVRGLQQALNSIGKSVTVKGQETTRFGEATLSAVQSLQCQNGIVCSGPNWGIFGPMTRGLLTSLIARLNPHVLGATTDGLVAYYTFDEGTGTTAGDSAGNSPGLLVGGTAWGAGKIGSGALVFDGVNDSVSFPTPPLPNTFSIAFWARSDGKVTSDAYEIMAGQYVNVISPCNNGGIYFGIATDVGGGASVKSSSCAPTAAWTHYVGTYDGVKAKLYVNGSLVGSLDKSGSVVSNFLNLTAGSYYGANSYNFHGAIDDLRMYNRALTADEVSQLSITSGSGGSTDTVAPSIPTGLSATAVSSSRINLSWTPSTDNTGILGYIIYRNGAQIGTVSGASYSDTGLQSTSAYSYKVSAFDDAGNISGQSSAAQATTQTVAAEDMYVAQTSFGNDSGSSCNNAKAMSWVSEWDSQNGGHNWATPKVQGKIGPGDTIHVCGSISTALSIMGSGVSGRPITITFEPGASMTKDYWGGTGAISTPGGTSADWIVIDGRNGVIQNTDTGSLLGHRNADSVGINITGNHVTIRDLTVKNIYVRAQASYSDPIANGTAINVGGGDLLIENTTLTEAANLISISNSADVGNVMIRGNTLSQCNHCIVIGNQGLADPSDPSGIRTIPAYLRNVTITDNHIDGGDHWECPTITDTPDKLAGAEACAGKLHQNDIMFLNESPDYRGAVIGLYIYKNFLNLGNHPQTSRGGTAGIFLDGYSESQYQNVYIFNNIFSLVPPTVWGNGFCACGGTNLLIANNSMIGGTSLLVGAKDLHMYNNLKTHPGLSLSLNTTAPITSQTSDYNLFSGTDYDAFGIRDWLDYVPGTGWVQYVSGIGGIYDSFAIWKTKAGEDIHSAFVPAASDLLLVNPTPLTGNYHLQAISPARGVGINLTSYCLTVPELCKDYDGKSRPATGPWDIGAYQYSSTPIDTTPPPVVPPPTPSDTTAPTISITAPVAGATVSGSVNLAVSASDDVGVVGVQYAVNGALLGAEAGSPFTGVWNTSAMTDGTYALTATARDASGKQTTSAPVSVVVRNAVVIAANLPPVANAGPDQIITLPAAATLSGALSSDPDQTTLTYSWTTTGGALTNANLVNPTIAFSASGTYAVTLTVSDGSLSASDSMNVTVLAAPIVVIPTDVDHDGVADGTDVCASTPTGLAVNLLGCPLPKTTEFPTLTNLQSVDLRSVSTFEIGNTYGKISYPVASLPYSLVRKINGIDNQLDIDAALDITQGKVTLDSAVMPELNRPAVITLYNMRLNKPAIKKNGVGCTGCTLISYDTGTKVLVFSVTGFSTYEIVEDDTVTAADPASGGSSAPAQGGGSTGGGATYTTYSITGTFVPTVASTRPQTGTMNLIGNASSAASYAFSRNLTIGTKGDDVRQLQRFLNGAGFRVAASGAGSPGLESTTFGPATRSALARYQSSKGIVPAAGYFGPATRASIGGGASAAAVSTSGAASTAPTAAGATLQLGSTGAAVKALRVRLRGLGYLAAYGSAADVPASAAAETSSFGATTEAALRKFQCDRAIVCTGTAATTGWGSAGARTRAALGL
jgi:chitodextrinase